MINTILRFCFTAALLCSSISLAYAGTFETYVKSSSPVNGAVNVSVNTSVTLVYSNPVEVSTVNANTFQVKSATDGQAVSGTITNVNNDQVTFKFQPANNLAPSSKYNVTSNGVQAQDNLEGGGTIKYSGSFTTSSSSYNLVGIAKGNYLGVAVYVAVGNNGTILTSADGFNWNWANSGTTVNLHAVTFLTGAHGSSFFAVGDDGKVLSSTDGKSWTLYATLKPAVSLYSIAHDNAGHIVVSGGSNTIFDIDINLNQITTVATAINNIDLISSAYGQVIYQGTLMGMFLIGGSDGSVFYRPESVTYWYRSTKFTSAVNSLAYDSIDQVFLAAESNGMVVFSQNDGVGWNMPLEVFSSTAAAISLLGTDPKSRVFYTLGNNGLQDAVASSSNFNSWSIYLTDYSNQLNNLSCFESNTCYSVGDNGTILVLNNAAWSSANTP